MMPQMMPGGMPGMPPIMQEILRMRQQGMDSATAFQQLAQRYPQFGQAFPFLSGKSPQQMDQAAQYALQQAGMNPDEMAQRLRQMF